MSASGHQRQFGGDLDMWASPLTPDISLRCRERSKRAMNRLMHRSNLFDHLSSAHQNRSGYDKTERLGGLEVHDHLKFGRKLHREIARLLGA